MKRKVKRKYVRRVVPIAVAGDSSPLKDGGGNKTLLEVTQADIDSLPPSLKYQLEAETRARKAFKMPDNLRERQDQMVRRFRGR